MVSAWCRGHDRVVLGSYQGHVRVMSESRQGHVRVMSDFLVIFEAETGFSVLFFPKIHKVLQSRVLMEESS